MLLGLNWVDLVILFTLIFFTLEAFRRPFIVEVLDLFSFLLAFFLSFRYYNLPGKLFETQFSVPHGLSLVLGFMVAWFLSEFLFYLVVRLILPPLHRLKHLEIPYLSLVPALLRGLLFIALLLVLLATFPIQPRVKQAVLDSKIGSYMLNYAYGLEQPVKNVFGGVSNDTLTFLTIEPKDTENVNLGFKTDKFTVDESEENAMLDLVNKDRSGRGLNTLTLDPKLLQIARDHSADMFKGGYFSHYTPEGKSVADRANQAGISYLVIGENLAYAPNLELAYRGLMNSPGHRANILSPDYHKVGIGIMDGGVYGLMVTQDFSN